MGDLNDAMMRNRDAAVQARTKAQNRANVLQLKLIGQSHPTGLTTSLLKLFEPRPPLEYKTPIEKRKPLPYSGMAQYVSNFAEPGEPEYAPPVQKGETPVERRARIQKIRLEKGAAKAAEELQKYDPNKDPNITGDPYKTLFVARLNYETSEHQIKREFEAYGPIKRVRLITDNETNKPRGYAFIEYMHTRDMKTAYKQADGRKLDNKRVIVDVERGRTVPNWRPRRLGGGLGSTRIGGEDLNQKHSGREQQNIASGGPPRSEEPRVREDRHVDRLDQFANVPNLAAIPNGRLCSTRIPFIYKCIKECNHITPIVKSWPLQEDHSPHFSKPKPGITNCVLCPDIFTAIFQSVTYNAIVTERNHEKEGGTGKGRGESHENSPMIGYENGIQGKTGTVTTETVIGRETGTGKETVDVTVSVLVAETRRETVFVIMIGTASVSAIALARGSGSGRKTMSVLATKGTVVTHKKGMQSMITTSRCVTKSRMVQGIQNLSLVSMIMEGNGMVSTPSMVMGKNVTINMMMTSPMVMASLSLIARD